MSLTLLGRPGRLALIFTLVMGLLILPGVLWSSVWLSSIAGTCRDESGGPLASAVLRFTDPANGRWFETKTNAEGGFTYIAVEPSHYRVDVVRPKHQTLTFLDVYLEWSSQPLQLEVDLNRHSVKVTRQVLRAETLGTEPPAESVPVPESGDVAVARAINEKISAAQRYMAAGEWDNARSAAKDATEIDPNRDLPWAWLASVYCGEAQQETDQSARLLQGCVENYKVALAIAPNATYFNNLGAAYSSLNRWSEAAEDFRAALRAGSGNDSLYRLNLGTALLKQSEATTGSHTAELLQAAANEFERAASASSPFSDAYYWKGICALRLAGLGGPGSSFGEARTSFTRYLEVAPVGRYASEARAMVEGLSDVRLIPDSKSPQP
jgi:carboxypeptidase family protein